MKHIHKGSIENAYSILNGEYEIIEAEIIETSELINKELKNSNLPDEIRVGAILRGDEVIIPRSNFIFKKELLPEIFENCRKYVSFKSSLI